MKTSSVSQLLLLPLLGSLVCARGLASQSAPATRRAPLEVRRTHRIGCADCSGPELFSGVDDLTVRSDGSVVVADVTPPFLRAFGPDGAHLFSAMTRGEGPGEARALTSVAALADGRLLVWDNRLRRISVLDGWGRLLDTIVPTAFPVGLFGASDGSVYWTIETNFRDPPRFFVWSPDTLEPKEVELDLRGLGVAEEDLPLRLFPAAAGPGGLLALGEGEHAYRVNVFEPDGRRAYQVYRDIPRVAKSKGRIEEERKSRMKALGRLSGAEGANPEAAAGSGEIEIDPLERHFLLHDLAFDTEGRLWIRTPRGGDEMTIFDIFDDAGAYLGELPVQGRISRFAVGYGTLAVVTLDALDVQALELYQVRATPSPHGR